jgi:hypothetical protein
VAWRAAKFISNLYAQRVISLTYRVRYSDPHTRREMLSPPEIGFVAAVRYARTLEQQRGFVIRAIGGAEGEIGWNEAKALAEQRRS